MTASHTTPRTPITRRADRADERIRLIEEAILLIRGEWPAAACGLYETVNRATGLIIGPPKALDAAIEKTLSEALGLVRGLYGEEAEVDVRRLAAIPLETERMSRSRNAPFRRRVHFPHLPHRRAHARAG